MKRWERVGLDPVALRQGVANLREGFATLEDRSPGVSPIQTRSIDVSDYAFIAAMHHFEVKGTPGADGVWAAQRSAVIAVDYFFGSWRDQYLYEGKRVEMFDAAMCRRRLEWFDVYRDGLLCGLVSDDQESLESLLEWPGLDLRYDDGTWDSPQEENDFHILLALVALARSPARN